MLLGPCPSKKNLLRVGKGRLFRRKDVAAAIDSLTLQARAQWCAPPVEHPTLCFRFYVPSLRSDRDNRLTTILDCLQAAGVLVNDNSKHANGVMTILPAVVDKNERTEIEVA